MSDYQKVVERLKEVEEQLEQKEVEIKKLNKKLRKKPKIIKETQQDETKINNIKELYELELLLKERAIKRLQKEITELKLLLSVKIEKEK